MNKTTALSLVFSLVVGLGPLGSTTTYAAAPKPPPKVLKQKFKQAAQPKPAAPKPLRPKPKIQPTTPGPKIPKPGGYPKKNLPIRANKLDANKGTAKRDFNKAANPTKRRGTDKPTQGLNFPGPKRPGSKPTQGLKFPGSSKGPGSKPKGPKP